MGDMRRLSYFQPQEETATFWGLAQEIEDKACKKRNGRINILRNIYFRNK